MYADYPGRYGHNHRLNRTSLAASSLICGALVASVALVAPKVVPPNKPVIIQIDQIPIDRPPPPDPVPKPQAHARTVQTLPTAPIPQVPLPQPITPADTTLDLKPLPTPSIDLGLGDGTGLAKPVPTPSPALIEAGIDPRYANDFQPPYPPSEERAGSTGVVTVRVLIGVDGRVKQLDPVSQTSDAFLAATRRQALTRWRFRPATRGGIPVETWKTMTVRFVLND